LIDFMLLDRRNTCAAHRFLGKATMRNWPPHSITTDKLGPYPKAIGRMQHEGSCHLLAYYSFSFTMGIGGNMNTAVIIEQIDKEISRLQQAKVLLTGEKATLIKRSLGRPKTSKVAERMLSVAPGKRVVSAETKAKMVQAQAARWAAKRK
jgi:hypothetical protein